MAYLPELVLLARNPIALSQQQQEALRDRVATAQPRSEELRVKLERETAALATLAKPEHVDEAELIAQLDKVLDAERELKHLHIGLLVAIKNLLTPEQQTQLREIAKEGGTQLAEATRNRLTDKVAQVQAGMQKWQISGRDPSSIGKAMEEKVKPLLDAGKPIEAEAELDRVIELLKPDAK